MDNALLGSKKKIQYEYGMDNTSHEWCSYLTDYIIFISNLQYRYEMIVADFMTSFLALKIWYEYEQLRRHLSRKWLTSSLASRRYSNMNGMHTGSLFLSLAKRLLTRPDSASLIMAGNGRGFILQCSAIRSFWSLSKFSALQLLRAGPMSSCGALRHTVRLKLGR